MEEGTSIKDEIRKLNENLNTIVEKKEAKKFKIPRVGRLSKRQVKNGYTTVLHINENREVHFTKVPIKEGTIMVNGGPHVATTDYMLTHKNKPFLIVPEWDTEPYSPTKNYDAAAAAKRLNIGHRLLLNALLREQIKPKANFGGFIWVIIIIALLAGGYYLLKGKVF